MKLRTRMLLQILGAVALMIVLMVVIIALQARYNMMNVGNELIKEESEKIAAQVEAELNTAMDTARTLAAALSGMREIRELDRHAVNLMLRRAMEENPQFYAVWSAWEPNAFDGKDAMFRRTQGTDETGRFISYWLRDGNQYTLQALENYDVPGEGDYYLLAQQRPGHRAGTV